MSRTVLFIAVLLVLAGCSVPDTTGSGGGGGGGGGGGMDPLARDFMAYDACKDVVGQQLKAPGSADFESNTDVSYATSAGDLYTVTGWVDAQNSFGAKLRNDWVCQVNVTPDGTPSNAQVIDIAPH